jgi:hypothetical protein
VCSARWNVMSHHIPSARRGGQALGVVLVWTCSSDAAEPTQAVIPLVYVCVAQRDGVERALRRAVYPGAYLSYLPTYLTCLPGTNAPCAQNQHHGSATSCSNAAVSRPWLLAYTRCDLAFLCPALARLTSFRKACLCADLQCLCAWYGFG